ncbi:hypothetical protein TRFO_17311 [Tritrichomonas foetus]|uniref:Uncharacterized protein n=1 Tax=Tritrichomonas foetus TaxID=1144522 RepID=A0A1J4KTE8_9EUKA|nr:hypothetical protein TRFO_17311 [Tritrichomonas foetus]|eukprot:OHT12765.1 hypothetical protein TRFO_17311 [Tritrichomonas foetus]
MWETEQVIALPRSKKPFSLSLHKRDLIFIKGGKGYVFFQNSWLQIKAFGLMTNKICRYVQSQSRKISLHLPTVTPILAIHENRHTSIVLTLPIPFNFMADDSPYGNIYDCINTTGEPICVATTYQRVGDLPFIFSQQAKFGSPFSSHVKHMAVSDDARIIAVDFDDQLWVWNQLPEQVRGDGNWVNLSSVEAFNYQKYDSDGQNSPLAFQKLAAFRNPDEGSGICYLTCLLPPCKPFDMLYLFNSVCVFSEKRKYFRYHVKIPVLEGHERPAAYWSPCCRLVVISVNNSIVMLTRELQVIATIPLKKVFMGENPMVHDLAWSSNCQYFVMTSTNGFVGVVTRNGKSLKHCICDLPLFQEDYYQPLNIAADTDDPNLYIIYSQRYMRFLRIDGNLIECSLGNLISLPFPMKNAEPLIKHALKAIDNVNPSDPYSVVQLIYWSDLYGIFRYQSPLRYPIYKKIDESLMTLLKEGHHLLTFFLIRCAYHVTSMEPTAYKEVTRRLGYSRQRRDSILLRILNEELEKRDWGYIPHHKQSPIMFYSMTNKDEQMMYDRTKPEPNKSADLQAVMKYIREILYDTDFYAVDEVPVDLSMLFEMMIELGRFDRAALLSHHESIATDPLQLFIRISSIHAGDPINIFRAMEVCINSSPVDEPEFRAVAVMALNNILKQLIADSAPNAENPKPRMLSNFCVIEESVDIPVPESPEQCKDFAVVLGIALCAADYMNIQNFCNGKSMNIATRLLPAVKETIQLIWFVRWRYLSMKETFVERRPGNATLRMIPFNDFIDPLAIRETIERTGKSTFDPAVYELYMKDDGAFEKDPAFIDFICELAVRITPRLLSRIQIAVSSFADKLEDVPESQILGAVICSHVVPWLRCGIPRKMVEFNEAREIVPNEIMDFEDFILLEEPKPLQIDVKPTIDIPGIAEIPDEEEEKKEEPKNDEQLEMPPEIPKPDYNDDERQLSEGEEPPKPKKKHKTAPQKPKVKSKPKKKERKEKPMLRLIEVDKTPRYNNMNIVALHPPHPEFTPGYQFNPMPGTVPPVAIFECKHAPFPQQSYGPIWDLDPSLYERPYPRPPPNIPLDTEPPTDPPTKLTAESQCESRFRKPKRIPKVIITSAAKPLPIIDEISDDTASDVSLASDHEKLPPIDPFPLDDELRKRVDNLLNNPVEIKTPQLPMAPRYYTKVRTEHIIDHEYKESK